MNVSYTVQGTGPAVVFLHGVGSGKEGWRNQIDCVVEAGWQFIAIDAPGFGETPLPKTPGFTPHVQAVYQVMDELKLTSATICGHSLGGMTAQEIYAAHPSRIDALLLSATSPAFGRSDGDFQKKFLSARFEPFDNGMTMPEFAREFSPKLVDPTCKQEMVEEIANVMTTVTVEAYRLAMQTITTFDQRGNLAKIAVPTLLIAGASDDNSPAPMMKKMASKIAGADYVELATTGHMAPVENAAAFNHHLVRFLKKVSK